MTISFADKPHPPDLDERYHQLNAANIARVVYWNHFFRMIGKVPGDIVECGVGRGRSLMILCALNALFPGPDAMPRHIYAYDSFEGFPEPAVQDHSFRRPEKGEWAFSPSGYYRYAEDFLQRVLENAHLTLTAIPLTFHRGFFHETLSGHPPHPIALLHLDGDLYESHKVPLEHLFHLISPGGLLVLDDVWDPAFQPHPPFPGADVAVKEFLGPRYADLKTSMLGNRFFVINSNG